MLDKVLKERGELYGDYILNVQRITELNKLVEHYPPIERTKLMYIFIKVVRIWFNTYHKDSWVDLAGYAKLNSEISIDNPIETPSIELHTTLQKLQVLTKGKFTVLNSILIKLIHNPNKQNYTHLHEYANETVKDLIWK